MCNPEVENSLKFVMGSCKLCACLIEESSELESNLIEFFVAQSEEKQKRYVQMLGMCGSMRVVLAVKEEAPEFWDMLSKVTSFLKDNKDSDVSTLIQMFISSIATKKFSSAFEISDEKLEVVTEHIKKVSTLFKSLPLTTEEQKQMVSKAEGFIPLLADLQNNSDDFDVMELLTKLAPLAS
jgi:hypothetical protein